MSDINPYWYFDKLPVRPPIPLNIIVYKLTAYIRLRTILCSLLKTLISVVTEDAHPCATLNTTRIVQLGAILHTRSPLEGVGEEEDVREDKEDAEGYNQPLQLQLLN
jgi:hypothetical protein